MAKLAPKLFKIELNGVDVSNYLYRGNTVKYSNQAIKSGTFDFKNTINTALTINNTIIGKSFTVQRGFNSATERYIFRGEVVSYKLKGSLYSFNVSCKMYVANRLNYEYTWDINTDPEAGVGSEIVKTIYDFLGLTYTTDSIVTTGNATLNTFVAKGSAYQTLTQLAKIYDYQFFYKDSDDTAYFIPRGYNTTTTVLTTGTNIINRIQWDNTGEDLINNLTIVGGQQLDWATETFTGPATEITLTAKPVDTDITVNGVQQQRGVNSSDPKDFYVLSDQKKIIFTTSSSTITVNYSYNIPVKVKVSDYNSISDYVQVDGTITESTLINTDDAELLGNASLTESGKPLTNGPIYVLGNNDLELNDLIEVVDKVNNKDLNVVINTIQYTVPYTPDQIGVGKVPFNQMDWIISTSNNIQALQKQLATDSDVNVQLINQQGDTILTGYTIVEESLAEPDGLYWDSPTQGYFDLFYWDGTGAGETYRITSITPLNETIFEDFYTEDFKDTVNTDATWSTTGSTTFTDGQIAQSTFYFKDLDTTIKYITLTASATGTLTYEVSADGTNWETVTSGTEKTLTNQGNYIYWRATSTGASTLNHILITYR